MGPLARFPRPDKWEEGRKPSAVPEDSGSVSHVAKLNNKHLESQVLREADRQQVLAFPVFSHQELQCTIQMRQSILVL